MSYYAQSANLNIDANRLIELTDTPTNVGVADMVLVERLGTETDALIDGLLFGKYITPVPAPIPAILALIALDIWRFRVYSHRETMEVPGEIQREYDRSYSLLKDYARGDELLAAVRVQAPSDPITGGGSFSSDSDDRFCGRAKDFI